MSNIISQNKNDVAREEDSYLLSFSSGVPEANMRKNKDSSARSLSDNVQIFKTGPFLGNKVE